MAKNINYKPTGFIKGSARVIKKIDLKSEVINTSNSEPEIKKPSLVSTIKGWIEEHNSTKKEEYTSSMKVLFG